MSRHCGPESAKSLIQKPVSIIEDKSKSSVPTSVRESWDPTLMPAAHCRGKSSRSAPLVSKASTSKEAVQVALVVDRVWAQALGFSKGLGRIPRMPGHEAQHSGSQCPALAACGLREVEQAAARASHSTPPESSPSSPHRTFLARQATCAGPEETVPALQRQAASGTRALPQQLTSLRQTCGILDMEMFL